MFYTATKSSSPMTVAILLQQSPESEVEKKRACVGGRRGEGMCREGEEGRACVGREERGGHV